MKTNFTKLTTGLLALTALAFAAAPAHAQTLADEGAGPNDVYLDVRTTDTSNPGFADDLTIDLGPESSLLAAGNSASFNISSEMSTVFGANWATDSGVLWSVAATNYSDPTSSTLPNPTNMFMTLSNPAKAAAAR